MQAGIVLSSKDVKEIIAKHFDVPEEAVIQTKYSYIVVGVKCLDTPDMHVIK